MLVMPLQADCEADYSSSSDTEYLSEGHSLCGMDSLIEFLLTDLLRRVLTPVMSLLPAVWSLAWCWCCIIIQLKTQIAFHIWSSHKYRSVKHCRVKWSFKLICSIDVVELLALCLLRSERRTADEYLMALNGAFPSCLSSVAAIPWNRDLGGDVG